MPIKNKRKKKWATPQLVVLVRGRLEERVLAACKSGATGASSVNSACHQDNYGCEVCSVNSAS